MSCRPLDSAAAEAILQRAAVPSSDPLHGLQLGPRIRAPPPGPPVDVARRRRPGRRDRELPSQVERDVTSPSIATVQRIAGALDLSIAQLFAEEPSPGRVVRREEAAGGSLSGLQGRRRVPDLEHGRPAAGSDPVDDRARRRDGEEPYARRTRRSWSSSRASSTCGCRTSTTSCARATRSRSRRDCRTGT